MYSMKLHGLNVNFSVKTILYSNNACMVDGTSYTSYTFYSCMLNAMYQHKVIACHQ